MLNTEEGEQVVEIALAKPLEGYLRWGMLLVFPTLLYWAPLVPLALYSLCALGMLSWYLFSNSYALAVRLHNERTITEFIASMDEGTLSDIVGLTDSKEQDDDED